jgi:hypothetical protein
LGGGSAKTSPKGVSTKDVNKMEKINEEEKAFPSGEQQTNTQYVGPKTSVLYPLGAELENEEYRWKKVFHCLHYGKYFTLKSKCFDCTLLLSWYGRMRV